MSRFVFNPADVHIDAALTTISQGYRNEETVWRQVAPLVPVTRRSDRYFIFGEAEHYETTDDSTAPNADAREIVQRLSDDSYRVTDHALGAWVPVEAIENAADPIEPEARAIEGIRRRLELRHELRVAQLVFAVANYPTDLRVTLSGTSQWSNTASNPVREILTRLDLPLQRPNRLLLGANTWRELRQHASVVSAVFPAGGNAATGGRATLAQFAELVEVEQVIVGRARHNAANPGQTTALARIWGNHAVAYYLEPRPSIETATFAVTFSESQSNIVREFDAKKGVKGSVYVKDGWNQVVRLISPRSAFFWENAVA